MLVVRKERAREELDVGRLVRRFGRVDVGAVGQRERRREQPTRAKVLGLRRYWERVGRESGV